MVASLFHFIVVARSQSLYRVVMTIIEIITMMVLVIAMETCW